MSFFGDFTAFFAADFLAAGVFAVEDILSNKKGCWQPGLSSVQISRHPKMRNHFENGSQPS
jgi:hypothetical protein